MANYSTRRLAHGVESLNESNGKNEAAIQQAMRSSDKASGGVNTEQGFLMVLNALVINGYEFLIYIIISIFHARAPVVALH